jgi:transcriptional regulator with AAA-type ATPase domain
MRYTLKIKQGGKSLLDVRVPFSGITFGCGEKGDILFPDVPQNAFVSFSPTGKGLSFRVKAGPELVLNDGPIGSGQLRNEDRLIWGDYQILVESDSEATLHLLPEQQQGTATMQFDSGSGVLEMTTNALTVIEGPDKGFSIPIDQDLLTMGTDPACDFVLTDPYISGRHSALVHKGEGYFLRDLGSTNGTFIGNTRVLEAMVQDQSEFKIGETILKVGYEVDRVELSPFTEHRYGGMIGRSDTMRRIFSLIEKVAPTKTTVLLEGETGTGKELAARAVHQRSHRSSGPFVAINCGAIPPELVESELFGHVRGAFSGAHADRRGVFELANGGTLFLDEISELPTMLQPKLLRVLEEGAIRKVGAESEFEIDVRIVAATNKSLKDSVEQGQFRKDLYYRLAMIKVLLPPLKNRPEDIPMLIEHFLVQEAKSLGISDAPKLREKTKACLMNHSWPGNIRELRNVIRRSLIVGGSDTELEITGLSSDRADHTIVANQTLAEIEKAAILRALKSAPSRKQAAKNLGIAVSTLYDKIKKYNID